jgi:anaerobic magnesium-protoporphyrin IX monomethyl ester cyclase
MKIMLIALGRYNLDPYGLRILSAYLKQHDYEVELLLLPFGSWEEHNFSEKIFDMEKLRPQLISINEFILERKPDLVGLSVLTNFFEHAAWITDEFKKKSQVPVIWGCTHPTVDPEGCLKHADLVCIGEGEDALLELAGRIEAGKAYNDISNIWVKENGHTIRNSMRPLAQDLDRFPFPDYSIEGHFVLHERQVRPMDQDLLYTYLPHNFSADSIGYSVVATRGCPYTCTYCVNYGLRKIYQGHRGKIVRRRSIDNVIEEISRMKHTYPKLTHINIADETFLLGNDLDWIAEFCDKYKSRINLPFFCCLRPENISQAALNKLVDAGCFFVQMGIQSGSQRTLREVYHRKMDLDLLVEKAHILNQFPRIMPCYDIILDNPYETNQDLINTIDFLLRLPKPFRLQLFSLVLFPGSQLYERAKQDGRLQDINNQVIRKSYEAYDSHNYYNLLISVLPFWPENLIRYLKNRRDPLHKWGLIGMLRLWEARHGFTSTWPYRLVKKFLTQVIGIKPPAAEVTPFRNQQNCQ